MLISEFAVSPNGTFTFTILSGYEIDMTKVAALDIELKGSQKSTDDLPSPRKFRKLSRQNRICL